MAETPCCTQTSRLCLLWVRSHCRLKFFIAWIGNFGYLLRKMVENMKFFYSYRQIFWPIIDCFSMYVTGLIRIQGVVSRRSSANRCVWSLLLTWQRWQSHHTIRHFWKSHAMRKFTTLSFIEPELLPIEVLHWGNTEFCVFLRKIVKLLNFFFAPQNDVAKTLKHIFWPNTDCSISCATGVTRIQLTSRLLKTDRYTNYE